MDNCVHKRVCAYNLLTQRACSRSANNHVARNKREIRIGMSTSMSTSTSTSITSASTSASASTSTYTSLDVGRDESADSSVGSGQCAEPAGQCRSKSDDISAYSKGAR